MSGSLHSLGADWAGRPPIAVVGLGTVLPGARNLAALRELLRERQPCFMDVPAERWDWRRYYAEPPGAPDRTSCRRGAFLRDIPFSPADFQLPPSGAHELHRMDRALLVAAREALADAALTPSMLRRQQGAVILGFMGYGTPSQRNIIFKARLPEMLAAARASLERSPLPPAQRQALLERAEALYRQGLRDEQGLEDRIVNVYSSTAAARIARYADIRGPHRVVDAACASSFAALAEAVQGLQDGRYDTVITGGASPQITPLLLVGLSPLGVLGRAHVTPFRKEGGGTLLGEGATVVVLRRLGDALREGQRVRAVLRGLGVAGSGGGQALFTSSVQGQAAALRSAYARAGYGPEAVQYVEAHANGVPEGDRVELEALNAAFAPAVRPGGRVALGSLKDRIGYLLSGAGAAGLARTVLALEEGVLPYQADTAAPDEELPFAQGPFYLSTQPAPWVPAEPGLPRRAGVSAFGFGGVNYHLTLESFEPEYHRAAPAAPARRTLREEPVAVLGLGVVLPGSPEPGALWTHLLTGRELGREQEGAWFASRPRDWEGVPGAFVRRAARVEGFRFSSERLRLPPRVAERMDPGHLWLLSAAEQALAQAGLRGPLPERTAVFVAATPGSQRVADLELRVAYAEFAAALERALEEAGVAGARALCEQAELTFKAALPTFSEDSLLGTLRNVAAGRLAQALGARGPCHALDAACASSCAALESALRGLVAGDFDVAIVGGFWSGLSAEYFLNTAAFGGNSAGVCRPFDARADGAIPGEGAAVVVLQREREARASGRPVQALIRGLGASGNGLAGSLYSASVPGMVRAIRAALEEPGIAPETVGLIEAHGSCTPVGDGAELKALGSVYGGPERAGPVVLACLKASLGNLMSASGLASLVATVLSLRHGLAPPVLHSRWDEGAPPEARGLRLPAVARPFRAAPGQPLRAAVSAYAMGGVNYHVLVEAA